jgi:CDP-L-myo-inositol myo-inositolphosphotransferase
MDHAIVVAAGTGIDGEKLSLYGDAIIGGIPQIKRLVITAERAGIKRFTILVEKDGSPLKEILNKKNGIKSNILWHTLGSPIKSETNPSLILQSNLVITPSGLSNLMDSKVSEDGVAILVDNQKDAWVKISGNNTIDDIFSSGGKAVGAFVAHVSLLEKSILNSMHLKSWLEELVGRGNVKSVNFQDGYWMHLSSDNKSAKRAESLLFSHVSKSSSGWISKNINSKMSIPVSRLLIHTSLTPNMISVAIGIIGILSGIFYMQGYPILGGVFLELSTIFDRCDGEVARIKLMESRRGQWIDTIFDQLSFLSFVIGVPIGLYKLTKSNLAITLGSINLGIFTFFVIWSFYFLIKYANSGSMVAYSKTVDTLVPIEGRTFIHKLIIKLRPMMKREFFSLVFLIAAILGGYTWVLCLTTLGLSLTLIHQIDDLFKLKRLKQVNVNNPT